MTSLDSAYIEAKKSGKESIFYNTFFNATIFIPTANTPENEQIRRTGDGDKISPIIIESDGVNYLMLFDTEERLASWAQREVGFVTLAGHVVVEMMSGDLHWILNVGTEHMKTFVPEEIKWMKEGLNKTQELEIKGGTEVLIGAPAKIPVGLVESLIKNFSLRNNEIKNAYLGQVFYVKEGEKPHLALVLDIAISDKSIINAICQDISVSTKGLLGESEYIDIMINDGHGTAMEITKSVKPFYSKGSWFNGLIRKFS